MEEKLVVKYYSSQYGKEPFKATEDAAGYDLFAAEAWTLFAKSCTALTTEIKIAIPKGFYGEIFPRSRLLKNDFITCDDGVIDADYMSEVNTYWLTIVTVITQLDLTIELLKSFWWKNIMLNLKELVSWVC